MGQARPDTRHTSLGRGCYTDLKAEILIYSDKILILTIHFNNLKSSVL